MTSTLSAEQNAYSKFFQLANIQQQCQLIRDAIYLIQDKSTLSNTVINAKEFEIFSQEFSDRFQLIGFLPPIYPENLGCPSFLATHGTRFPYVIGAMANGIATAQMVIEAARAGCIGFFGAAGLSYDKVLENIIKIKSQIQPHQINWGSNLIHSPHEPQLEEKVTALYLQQGVERISASAYMQVNPNIVHYALKGLHQNSSGKICRKNYIFAKISRPEVARQFMSPPPEEILEYLLKTHKITPTEAQLARHVPIAQDITVESDSGGHTDNRPLSALFSSIQSLAKNLTEKFQYTESFRLGAAGGIGTPLCAASAFGLGASYILTGSINQSTLESGLSSQGKELLLKTEIADIAMAPAADMFELGVNVQVLKRGTLFAQRAKKLYELYQRYPSLQEIPPEEKMSLEKNIFKNSLEEVWEQTRSFFEHRDTTQLEKAKNNPKHQMALVFRWYLGLSSQWAINGNADRAADYQIWCGPAMGAFNQWLKNSVLEPLENRKVSQIALNLLEGAAVLTRVHQLRGFNVPLPIHAFHYQPQWLT